MRGTSLTGVACATLVFFFLNPPAASLGEELSFVPTITYSEGYLEMNAQSYDTQSTQGGQRTVSDDRLLTESVRFAADGFVYHPRFLVFNASLSEGLNEESGTGVSRTGAATSYQLRTVLLPEHPYNLELFKLHQQRYFPGAPGGVAGLIGTVDEQGAIFKYKRRPLSFQASYFDTSVDSTLYKADTNSYRVNGAYNGQVVTDTASYTHSETQSTGDRITTRDEYTAGNNIRYEQFSLDSRVNNITHEQTSPLLPDFQATTFFWTEQLAAALPWNFTANASTAYRNEVDKTGETPSGPATEESNRSNSTMFSLSHQLYRSLTTNYSLVDQTSTSSSGEITSRIQTLGTTYTKTIPTGRLTAGIQLGNSDSERTGTPVVLNEAHTTAVPGTFMLVQQNVLASTIQIQVKDPGTGTLITLRPQIDYVAGALGNSIQITVVSVFTATPEPPGFVYEFRASYMLSVQSKFTSTFSGYRFRLDLLDSLLAAYFNYLIMGQEVVSGSLAGGPERTASKTVGMTVNAGPYSGLVEYQDYDSRLNPYKSRKATATYRTPLGEDTNATASLFYTVTDYLPTLTSPAEHRASTEGTSMGVDMKFPQDHLVLLMGGSYYRTSSTFDSDTVFINTSLTWQLGLFSVTGGAQLNRQENMLATTKTTLNSQYYYMTLSRKLF